MRRLIVLGSACALVAVAACNRAEDGAPREDGNVAAAPSSDGNEIVGNQSAPPSAEQIATIMHDRHENFERMGDAMKAVGRELKGGSPDVALIQRHAATFARYGEELLTWFPAGSGPETGRETRAKAEIWQDLPTFRQRGEAFRAESARFAQIAQAGDIAAIRAAMPQLGDSCKNCHDRFRAPER